MTEKALDRAKMALCQAFLGCEGPFFLPCGSKQDDPSYCEEWKDIPLTEDDISMDGEDINISTKNLERVKREWETIFERKQACTKSV